MTEYRTRLRAYEFEPTIDWRALFALSSLLSVGICVGHVDPGQNRVGQFLSDRMGAVRLSN
jgi:hypothetical protein